MTERFGDSTRTVKAVDSEAVPGQPVGPVPVPASAFHLSAAEGSEDHVYGRYSNPVWTRLETALAGLEEATSAVSFGSGMAAVTAALRVLCSPGQVLVVPADGYHQVRRYATECLAPLGVTVREVMADRLCDAALQADVVLAETPTNPALDVVDLHRLAGISRETAQARLLREFQHRVGDPNTGGSVQTTLMTSYRQDALRCLKTLNENGPTKAADVAQAAGVSRARTIMADDHYGWFERVERGIYAITPKGEHAIGEYAHVLEELE